MVLKDKALRALWLEFLPRVSERWQVLDLLPLRQLRQAIRRSAVERHQVTSPIRLSEALLRSTTQAAQCPVLHQVCPRQERSLRQEVHRLVVGLARHRRLVNTALRRLQADSSVARLRVPQAANTVRLQAPNTAAHLQVEP